MAGKIHRMRFPLGGLNRAEPYRDQPPFTTPDACNVLPLDVTESRARGGSRPGLTKYCYEQIGSGAAIRLLWPTTIVRTDMFALWEDDFEEATLRSVWSAASWVGTAPSIFAAGFGAVTYNEAVGAVRTALSSFDTTQAYSIEVEIVPWKGEFSGRYKIYARLDNTTPALLTAGTEAELVMTGSSGAYSGTLRVYAAGVLTSYAFTSGTDVAAKGVFRMLVTGDNIKCYWRGNLLVNQNISAAAGARFGFGMDCTEPDGMCLLDRFRIAYYAGDSRETRRTILCASGGGEFWYENTPGTISKLTTNLSLNSASFIQASDHRQKLYIADWGNPKVTGTDGVRGSGNNKFDAASVADWTAKSISAYDDVLVISNATGDLINGVYQITVAAGELTTTPNCATGAAGGCTFRVERGPKHFTFSTTTLALWIPTTGTIPVGCRCLVRYMDCAFLAGNMVDPQEGWLSRQGNPLDFDWSQTDAQAAKLLSASNAGVPGIPITALVPQGDDYCLIAGRSELWRLKGHPYYGTIENVSYKYGIIAPSAWDFGDAGELYFLSERGLCMLQPGASGEVQNLSGPKIPEELIGIDPGNYDVSVAYDPKNKHVHINATAVS